MGLLLQGGNANIANIQFEGGDGNKSVIITKEGGKLVSTTGTDISEMLTMYSAELTKREECRTLINELGGN